MRLPWLAVALALGVAVPVRANPPPSTHHGSAAGDDDDDDDDASELPGEQVPSGHDAKPAAKKPPPKQPQTGDDDDDDDDTAKPAPRSAAPAAAPAASPAASPKQNLAGHAMGEASAGNKDRFFVDKTDTDATAHRTLIQGSLTLSTFLYAERGGAYGGATSMDTIGNDTSAPSIYWGDLRLQTDFRHIAGGRWDARADVRLRVVDTPPNNVVPPGSSYITPTDTQKNLIQSGLVGQNEYDLRELWATHSGESTDVTIGRQFIQDLGAVKIDGLRVDYASSPRFTYLGFAGLYPVRGSRSLTTDYAGGIDPFTGKDEGSITGAAGGGAAYRTQQAYGSFGVVGLVPVDAASSSRVFLTSTGYWRINPELDFYHFALIDVATNPGLTNLSLGLNYKPIDRLRVTASFNRVDTDTINVQAAQFFTSATPAPTSSTVLNEIYVARIASNEARASVSGALGTEKRFELTVAAAYRERPSFDLNLTPASASASGGVPIDAAQSMEIYASFTDRRSIAKLRLGIDAMDSIPLGNNPYDRVKLYSVRGFAGRSFLADRGEWEAEVSYTSATDVDSAGFGCTPTATDPGGYASCYGASKNGMLAFGGTLYYRFLRNWFGVASLYVERTTDTTIQPSDENDAAIIGFTGYLRIAYRF